MRLIQYLLILICLASCSSEIIDLQEEENHIKEIILESGDKLLIASQNVNDDILDSFLSQISIQAQKPIEVYPEEEYSKSNNIEFLPFTWFKGSYYWTNTSKKNISYQTYTVSYQNINFDDQVMIVTLVRKIDKGHPIIPFYKWNYTADFGVGWKMTCVKAQLIGPDDKISKNHTIVQEEVRIIDPHMQ